MQQVLLKIQDIESNIGIVDGNVNLIDNNVKKIEGRVEQTEGKLGMIDDQFMRMDSKIDEGSNQLNSLRSLSSIINSKLGDQVAMIKNFDNVL